MLAAPTAKRLGVEPGESILVKLSTVTGQQNVGELTVVALTTDTGIFGSFSAYARLDDVTGLLNMDAGDYQQMVVRLSSIKDTDRVASRLYAELSLRAQMAPRKDSNVSSGDPGKNMGSMFGMDTGGETAIWKGVRYEMSTLNDMLGNFKSVVTVLDAVGLGILLVLLLITMVGIINTFRMIMLERIREIGTMRAIGVFQSGIRWIFLSEALLLALTGVVIGMALAFVVMISAGFIAFPTTSPVYLFLAKGHLFFRLAPLQVFGNLLLVSVLSLAAAFFPARSAARLDPASALRTQK